MKKINGLSFNPDYDLREVKSAILEIEDKINEIVDSINEIIDVLENEEYA